MYSLVSLISGIQQNINMDKPSELSMNFFKDSTFWKITETIDSAMKMSAKKRIYIQKKTDAIFLQENI